MNLLFFLLTRKYIHITYGFNYYLTATGYLLVYLVFRLVISMTYEVAAKVAVNPYRLPQILSAPSDAVSAI